MLHQYGQEELFEFISAERLQIEEVNNKIKHFLEVAEVVGPNVGVLFEKDLYFRGSGPLVFFVFCEDEDIIPHCLNDHPWVLYQL